MIDNENKGADTFEISLRVLGNELIGLRIAVNDMKQKWIIAGLITIAVVGFIVGEVGPNIVSMFQSA
jgi:hypothetical protein